MNAIPTVREMLPGLPMSSLKSFLEKLIPAGDILECSSEYGPANFDCFRNFTWNGVRICFLLNHEKTDFPAAGTLSFNRSEAGWGKSESLELELWFLFRKHLHLDAAKAQYADEPDGWKMLTLSWAAIPTHEPPSSTDFNLRASGFDSPSTRYCLDIVERAKTAL